MADKKISQLTAATTPLVGTEILPIVQGSSTVKVANNDLRPKQIQSNATSGVLQVAGPTAGTTRVMTTPDANFTAARTDAGQTFTGNNTFTGITKVTAAEAYVGIEATNANGKLWYLISGGGGNVSNGYLGLFNGTSGNIVWALAPSTTQDFVSTTTGDLEFRTGNLIIGTSGKGIDFSATSQATGMTSEVLADYEEGTWTPTLTGSSSNPTVTYGLQRGSYTKVGRLVTVSCYLTWSAFSGGSGDTYLSGLPFVIETSPGAYGGAGIAVLSGITYAASRTTPGLAALSGTTSARLQSFGSGVATTTISTSNVAASGEFIFSLTYSAS